MSEPLWARRRNRFREALDEGRHAVAMWVTTPWTAVPEILGAAGADAVLIDLEHVSHGVEQAERLIVAADAAGISALVRPPVAEPALVSRILDAGAHGIVFPHVDDAAAARRAVRCTRHAPAGDRGWGGAHTRHAMWQGGYAGDVLAGDGDRGVYTHAYVEAASRVVSLMLIESARGVENAAEIAAVDGVGGVIFGWGDYAVECGLDPDRCRAAARAVYEACRARGVGVALSAGDDFYPGCFTIAGVDSLLMSRALTDAVSATVSLRGTKVAQERNA